MWIPKRLLKIPCWLESFCQVVFHVLFWWVYTHTAHTNKRLEQLFAIQKVTIVEKIEKNSLKSKTDRKSMMIIFVIIIKNNVAMFD